MVYILNEDHRDEPALQVHFDQLSIRSTSVWLSFIDDIVHSSIHLP